MVRDTICVCFVVVVVVVFFSRANQWPVSKRDATIWLVLALYLCVIECDHPIFAHFTFISNQYSISIARGPSTRCVVIKHTFELIFRSLTAPSSIVLWIDFGSDLSSTRAKIVRSVDQVFYLANRV